MSSKAMSIVQAIMAKKQASQMTEEPSFEEGFDFPEDDEISLSPDDIKQQVLKKTMERMKNARRRSEEAEELN